MFQSMIFKKFVHFSFPYQSFKNPKIQIEHSHLIFEPNLTQCFFYWALYDNNIF